METALTRQLQVTPGMTRKEFILKSYMHENQILQVSLTFLTLKLPKDTVCSWLDTSSSGFKQKPQKYERLTAGDLKICESDRPLHLSFFFFSQSAQLHFCSQAAFLLLDCMSTVCCTFASLLDFCSRVTFPLLRLSCISAVGLNSTRRKMLARWN